MLTRPKQSKLTVHDAVCLSKHRYGHDTLAGWSIDRFQQWSENGAAIISGSTYADNQEHKEERVLDAAAARKYYDADGILKRTVLMTLDGLGHAADLQGLQQISGDNKHLIDAFDQTLESADAAVGLSEILITAGKKVYAQREKEQQDSARSVSENGSAMAVAIVEQDEKTEQMRCHIANIGDTMAIVLDHQTLALKEILPARQYISQSLSNNRVSCPTPAHLIESNPDALLFKSIDVLPGDVIILMTDGVFAELLCEAPEQKEAVEHEAKHYREIRLAHDALAAIFADFKGKNYVSEYEIAAAIVEHIQAKLIFSRAGKIYEQEEFNAWIQKRKAHIEAHLREVSSEEAGEGGMTQQNKDRYTIWEWAAWKEKHQNTAADKHYNYFEFVEDLKRYYSFLQYCFPAANNVSLADRTVLGLWENINRCQLRKGDCATLAVMRVPYPEVELVRAIIDFPENRAQLMSRLVERIAKLQREAKSFDGTAGREGIVAMLAAEQRIAPGSRGKAETVAKLPVYTSAQLAEMRHVIQQAIQLGFAQTLDAKVDLTQRNEEFLQFKRKLNLVHRNPWIDKLFGIKNTASWKTVMGQIRRAAFTKLNQELAEKPGIEQKICLLQQARVMKIFNDHRNNSVFFGAFGRTRAVQEIDEKIKSLKKTRLR